MKNVLVVEHKEKGMTGPLIDYKPHVRCERKHNKYYKEAQVNPGTKRKGTGERKSGDIAE